MDKFLITGFSGLVLGLGAGAVWNEVDKKKTKKKGNSKTSSTSGRYTAIIRSDPQLVSALDHIEGLGTIRPTDRRSLLDAMDKLGKHWMSIEATSPENLSSDAAFKAAQLYEEVHKSIDYMFENSGIPMSGGVPSGYEMKKVYNQILRSSGNWKHNATIAAQSKKRYL